MDKPVGKFYSELDRNGGKGIAVSVDGDAESELVSRLHRVGSVSINCDVVQEGAVCRADIPHCYSLRGIISESVCRRVRCLEAPGIFNHL